MSNKHNSLKEEVVLMRSNLDEVRSTLSKVVEAIERLTLLEERHLNTVQALDRAFKAISKNEARIRVLENSQPVQKLVANWVINAVWASAGVIATVVVHKSTEFF